MRVLLLLVGVFFSANTFSIGSMIGATVPGFVGKEMAKYVLELGFDCIFGGAGGYDFDTAFAEVEAKLDTLQETADRVEAALLLADSNFHFSSAKEDAGVDSLDSYWNDLKIKAEDHSTGSYQYLCYKYQPDNDEGGVYYLQHYVEELKTDHENHIMTHISDYLTPLRDAVNRLDQTPSILYDAVDSYFYTFSTHYSRALLLLEYSLEQCEGNTNTGGYDFQAALDEIYDNLYELRKTLLTNNNGVWQWYSNGMEVRTCSDIADAKTVGWHYREYYETASRRRGTTWYGSVCIDSNKGGSYEVPDPKYSAGTEYYKRKGRCVLAENCVVDLSTFANGDNIMFAASTPRTPRSGDYFYSLADFFRVDRYGDFIEECTEKIQDDKASMGGIVIREVEDSYFVWSSTWLGDYVSGDNVKEFTGKCDSNEKFLETSDETGISLLNENIFRIQCDDIEGNEGGCSYSSNDDYVRLTTTQGHTISVRVSADGEITVSDSDFSSTGDFSDCSDWGSVWGYFSVEDERIVFGAICKSTGLLKVFELWFTVEESSNIFSSDIDVVVTKTYPVFIHSFNEANLIMSADHNPAGGFGAYNDDGSFDWKYSFVYFLFNQETGENQMGEIVFYNPWADFT